MEPLQAPWQEDLSARLRDDSSAFLAHGDTWVAAPADRGFTGTFSLEGARLSQSGDEVGLQTLRWGRDGQTVIVEPTQPLLGDCVPGMADSGGACVRRLEYPGVGCRESWVSSDAGLEQGWTVDSPGPGHGPLVIELGVDAAAVSVRDGQVWLHSLGGEHWVVSGLGAWDADGEPLDARFEPSEGGFRVNIDDAGARYPITVDPVYTSATTTLTGTAGSEFG